MKDVKNYKELYIESDMEHFMDRLECISGVGIVNLTEEEIVRHPIIKDILKAL